MYATRCLMVILPCVKFGMPMSVDARKRIHVKHRKTLSLRSRVDVMNACDTSSLVIHTYACIEEQIHESAQTDKQSDYYIPPSLCLGIQLVIDIF